VPTLFITGTEDPYTPLESREIETPWGGTIRRPRLADVLEVWSVLIGGAPALTFEGEEDGVQRARFAHPEVEYLAYLVGGLGHHWPGGRGQLSRRLFGPPSDRLAANEVIANFFRRWALP
jgi:polyhydroxybutyrate depolymerase